MTSFEKRHSSLATDLGRLIFPARCCICDGAIESTGHDGRNSECPVSLDFCDECFLACFPPSRDECPRCGSYDVVVSEVTHDCNRCRRISFRMASVVALGNYQRALKDLVLAIKREKLEVLAFQLGRMLGMRLAQRMERDGHSSDTATIVPIPIHWWKRLRRGFHAPLVIADGMGHQTGWPVIRDGLMMRRLTLKQGTLSTRQRFANMRDSMAVYRSRSFEGPVVLVDDVMTSGATLNEAATHLAAAGAGPVWGAVLARGVRST